jgi:hypothetical protein
MAKRKSTFVPLSASARGAVGVMYMCPSLRLCPVTSMFRRSYVTPSETTGTRISEGTGSRARRAIAAFMLASRRSVRLDWVH